MMHREIENSPWRLHQSLQNKRSAISAPLLDVDAIHTRLSLARCLNVDINLLGSATSEQATTVDEQQYQNDDHKDPQNCYYPSPAASTAIVISHDAVPPTE